MASKSNVLVKTLVLLFISILFFYVLFAFYPKANEIVPGGLKTDGVYALLNKSTGRYLDVQYDSPEPEMYIQQYNYGSVPSDDSTRSGLFKFTHRGSDYYLIRTMRNNANSFYRTNEHMVKTTAVDPVDNNNPLSDCWILEDAGGGYVYLRAFGSTEYLSVYDYDSSNTWTKYCITQSKSTAGDYAKWQMIEYTGTELCGADFYNRPQNLSSVYMESSAQYYAYMWSTNMGNNGTIYWSIQNHTNASFPCSSIVTTTGELHTYDVKEIVDICVSTVNSITCKKMVDIIPPLETGLYNILSNFSNCYLDISGNSANENADIIQYNYSSAPNNESNKAGIFKIIWTGTDNKYVIRTMTNNFNGIKQVSTSVGSNIVTKKIYGLTTGIWRITRLNDTNYVIKVELASSNLALASPKNYYDESDRNIILAEQTSNTAKWNIQKINDITPFSGCHVGYYYPYILESGGSIPICSSDLDVKTFYSTDPTINAPGNLVNFTVKNATGQNSSLIAYSAEDYLSGISGKAGMTSVIANYQYASSDPINIYVKPTIDGFFFLQNIQSSIGFVKSFGTYAQKTGFDYDDKQIWRRTDAGGGYYYIQNMDGNYLTAPTSSFTNQPILLNASLLSGTDRDRQKWLFESAPSGSGGIRIRSANITNLYLNIKSSNGKLIQDTYVNNSSYYDEFNVIMMGDDVVFLRTLEGFSEVDPSILTKNLSHHYNSFTLMHKLNHLGRITDTSNPLANTNVAKDLLENSNVAIFNGHGSWEVITIYDNGQLYLRNTDIYISSSNHIDLSNMDIVIFAGCSTADDPPEGVIGYNMPKSAELAGAKVAIGWSVTQYGNEMNEWIDMFFEYMNQIDPDTGYKYTAKRAFDLTNAAFTTNVSFAALYGTNKFYKFN